ncbi:MAG: hypothetical protein M5U28_10550 [Sandaracinaceae bacterium]|nr:hypothetical protein [Sandaracinaceae bacterium]
MRYARAVIIRSACAGLVLLASLARAPRGRSPTRARRGQLMQLEAQRSVGSGSICGSPAE